MLKFGGSMLNDVVRISARKKQQQQKNGFDLKGVNVEMRVDHVDFYGHTYIPRDIHTGTPSLF